MWPDPSQPDTADTTKGTSDADNDSEEERPEPSQRFTSVREVVDANQLEPEEGRLVVRIAAPIDVCVLSTVTHCTGASAAPT